MNIPDEAVEAAHKAWRVQAATEGTIFEYNLRAALEAAAPYLMAEAWEGAYGLGYADRNVNATPTRTNPYRSQAMSSPDEAVEASAPEESVLAPVLLEAALEAGPAALRHYYAQRQAERSPVPTRAQDRKP